MQDCIFDNVLWVVDGSLSGDAVGLAKIMFFLGTLCGESQGRSVDRL